MCSSIVMICPCIFFDDKGQDDKGQKVEYYRALVRTVDAQGGVKYTLFAFGVVKRFIKK